MSTPIMGQATVRRLLDRRRTPVLVGLVGPLLVCVALRPFRDDLANTNAASP